MEQHPVNDGAPWTREQLILAFNLYCRIPFQRTKASNPRVMELAALIGRTPSSIARKLGNFGAFDPQLAQRKIVGLSHGSKLDREIWDEFHRDWSGLVTQAQQLLGALSPTLAHVETLIQPTGPSVRMATVEQRVHQTFFREAILSSYDSRCCITGIRVQECLVAGHIIPWSVSEARRTDPTNGLCLSATFDRLFDCGLIALEDDLTILISRSIRESGDRIAIEMIASLAGKQIIAPLRFSPDPACLKWHRESKFRDY